VSEGGWHRGERAMGGKHSDDETPPNHSAHHKADEKGENGDAEHRDTVEKNAESKVRGRRGGQQKGDGPGKPAKKPWSSGLAIKPAEVLLAVLVVCVGFCVWQKQAADAKVALCAQRHERGEYEEALKLCHEALVSYHELNELSKLVGWWKYGGILNGDVAQTTDNLGVVSMNIGDSQVALRYLKAALAMRMEKLGPDSLDVAATKDNMGLVYRQMGDLDQAMSLHKEALAIRLDQVGEKDLSTVQSRTSIANVHYQLDDYDAALMMYRRVLAVQEELLGGDHLDLAGTLQNLAQVKKHSDLNASWELYERSLAIIVGIYGHNHQNVADTLHQMGGVQLGMKKHDEAIETYHQALEIYSSLLGHSHPDVAATLTYIGEAHEKKGETTDAEDFFRQSVEIWDEIGVHGGERLALTRAEAAKEYGIVASAWGSFGG